MRRSEKGVSDSRDGGTLASGPYVKSDCSANADTCAPEYCVTNSIYKKPLHDEKVVLVFYSLLFSCGQIARTCLQSAMNLYLW